MIIEPSSALRNNYNKLTDFAQETGQPIFLTKNGSGHSVLLAMDVYIELMHMPLVKDGLESISKGDVITTDELESDFNSMFTKIAKEKGIKYEP